MLNYREYVHKDVEILEQERKSLDKCNQYFKDSIVFDIGAGGGLWSFVALACDAKKVIAFDHKAIDLVPPQERYMRLPREIGKNTTIDAYVKEHKIIPDFIKIDVEGMEMDVLEGMMETIKQYKPGIMVEAHDYSAHGMTNRIIKMLGEPTYNDMYPDGAGEIYISHLFYAKGTYDVICERPPSK